MNLEGTDYKTPPPKKIDYKARALKTQMKLIEKFGSYEKYREHMSSIGSSGGKSGDRHMRRKKGFGSMSKERLAEVSGKGGKKSRKNRKLSEVAVDYV